MQIKGRRKKCTLWTILKYAIVFGMLLAALVAVLQSGESNMTSLHPLLSAHLMGGDPKQEKEENERHLTTREPAELFPSLQAVQQKRLTEDAEATFGEKLSLPKRKLTDTGIDVSDPALYEVVDLGGDSSTATVMGMAVGYGMDVYERFVGGLRQRGFKGNIILGVAPDVSQRVLKYFKARGVTPKIQRYINCTYSMETLDANNRNPHSKERKTCAHPYPDIKIRWSRFPLQRDWLLECEKCTGPVLIMDVRDSIFQMDPFGPGSPPIAGLQVFQEHPNQTTEHWLANVPLSKCKGPGPKTLWFNKTMLCSGTTIGTRAAMLKYLEVMYGEMKAWIRQKKCHFGMNGDDQSIHNYLFYTGQLPFAHSIRNRIGIVNTPGGKFLT